MSKNKLEGLEEEIKEYSSEEFYERQQIQQELDNWEKTITDFNENKAYTEELKTKAAAIDPELMKQLLFRPCETRKDLRMWIKTFLHADLPDSTVDPTSNSSPLDLVWDIYRTCVWYDNLPKDELFLNSVFYCSRGSMKSLSASIAVLMVMIHTNRSGAYIGLIQKQASNAYNAYFRPMLEKPYIKDWVALKATMGDSELRNLYGEINKLQVMPLTMNKTSSFRSNFSVLDEIDKTKGVQNLAYENASGMLTSTHDKKLPLSVNISSRDSSHGKIQELITNADKTGCKVRHWNRLDITEKCSDERSGTTKVPLYIKRDTLYYIDHDKFLSLSEDEQKTFDMYDGYEGCYSRCKMFSACRGHLKHQRSKSKWLKTIEDTEKAIITAPSESMAMAQLLCWLPPTTGLVYGDFIKEKNVKTPSQMYKIIFGKEPEVELKIDELINIAVEEDVLDLYIGADAGYWHPAAVLIGITPDEEVFILKELIPTELDSPGFAHLIWREWGHLPILRLFPDHESPDLKSALIKVGFKNVSDRVVKDVQPGIATVKSFLRPPGTDSTCIYVNPLCTGLIVEMGLYSYKSGPDGKYESKPLKVFDHELDGVRYCLHTLFGAKRAKLWQKSQSDKSYQQSKPMSAEQKLYGSNVSPVAISKSVGMYVYDNRYRIKEIEDERNGVKTKKKRKGSRLDPSKM